MGIDLKLLLRWLSYIFFAMFVLIKNVDFLRLRKLELTICMKTFT